MTEKKYTFIFQAMSLLRIEFRNPGIKELVERFKYMTAITEEDVFPR